MPAGTIANQPRASARAAIPAEWLDLAPLDLPNLRAERYDGDSIAVPIGTFALADQDIILRVYGQINDLLDILSRSATPAETSDALHRFADAARFEHLRSDLRALGHATFAGDSPDHVTAKTVHDMRGGALAVLLLRLEIAGASPLGKDELRTLFILARDHGKIMRSAVCDLDLVRRERDLAPQSHHVGLLLEKWHEAVILPDPELSPVQLFVDCRFDGAVTECCLESAAIDRVFYNLMGNALRHAAGARLDLLIFEIPAAPGDNIRFVLRNSVDEADRERLCALAGTDGDASNLGALFAPGVSTTGSGLGLAIVADFVTQAFGIPSEDEALRLGYFGARLVDGKFTVWFHWPIARGGLGTPAKADAAQEVPTGLQHPEPAATGTQSTA